MIDPSQLIEPDPIGIRSADAVQIIRRQIAEARIRLGVDRWQPRPIPPRARKHS